MRKFVIIVIVFLTASATVSGNNEHGILKGQIIESISGSISPVAFANVLIQEKGTGTTSDINGFFSISAEQGNYHLIVSFIGYVSDTLQVSILAGETTNIAIPLESSVTNLAEVSIVAKQNRESETVLLMERKEATGIQQSIGAKELSKTGSSDVASGLTKVAGVSVVGSKHLFVRGMGDRYNSAYLNGMPIASPDPDKRVIPLDIFPTSIVSSLTIKKAFTTDLYGDFSGGAIDIRTKDYPDHPTLSISVGSGLNTQSTFKAFKTYSGGKYDYWGVDDGSRNIPDNIAKQENYSSISTPENKDSSGFRQNLSPIMSKASPNTSARILAGNFFKVRKGKVSSAGLGVLFMASHNTDNSFQQGKYRIINLQGHAELDYGYNKYTFNTNSSILGNLLLQINDRNKISYNLLFVNQSSDQTLETDGNHFDYEKEIFTRRYTYLQSNLLAHQISGKHSFLKHDKLTMLWSVSNNTANSKEPDRRQLVWLHENGIFSINSIDRLDNHRFFSELNESEWSKKAGLKYIAKQKEGENEEEIPVWVMEVGVNQKNKTRYFDYRQFIFDMTKLDRFFPDGVDPNNPDGYINDQTHQQGAFSIAEVPNPASAHEAELAINAAYLSSAIDITPKLNIYAGMRVEQSVQSIRFRDQQQPAFVRKERLQATDLLPALIARYSFNEANVVRLSASKTLSRPGFKELAPFEYTEFFSGVKAVGNPSLTNGTNFNADIRYEIYPRPGELMAVTGFAKFLQDPIERTMLSTASGQLQSFQNAETAYVAGAEFEVRKKLNTLFKALPVIRDLSAAINLSYIYSEVTLSSDSAGVSNVQTNDKRALQGASPYLINADISYEKELTENLKGTLALAYNVYGKRIHSVGIYGLGDIYELPVNTLNVVVGTEIEERWNLRVSVQNILNQSVRTVQATKDTTEEVNSYRKGTTIGFNITYKFY